MNLKEAYELQRRKLLALDRENKKLRDETASGKAFAEYERRIRSLTRENEDNRKYKEEYHAELEKALARIKYLESHYYSGEEFLRYCAHRNDEVAELRKQVAKGENLCRVFQRKWEQSVLDYQELITEKDARISELEEELAYLTAKLNTDGTNSSIPTSQTPYSKKKVVPNTRKPTQRKRGGQKGHKKACLEGFSEEEINKVRSHEECRCPECGSASIGKNGEDVVKDETDFEIVPVKCRHIFYSYKCQCCGKEFHSRIPPGLKEANQYGPGVKALALSMTNQGFVSINRTKDIVKGLSDGEVDLSPGYIVKLQKKASDALEKFIEDLRKRVIALRILYWDDTVTFVDTKRACIRFYGNEKTALYTAHEKKDKEGILADAVLQNLSAYTFVMHDHNLINYNIVFHFRNIECCQHLLRDLEKLLENTGHEWVKDLMELIQDAIHKRNQYLEEGKRRFEEEFREKFRRRFHQILETGRAGHQQYENRYFKDDERKLLKRLEEYEGNYFAWIDDFTLPVTNNLSERSLRFIKTKSKVSGQFLSIENAEFFARIRSYTETCSRNGVNVYEALERLVSDSPCTVEELLG